MRFRVYAAVVLAAAVACVGSLASAASLSPTGSVGSAIANGYDGDVTYSGNAAFGNVRFIASPNGSALSWRSANGLGINCPRSVRGCSVHKPHQIDPPEVLTVQFERSVFLTSVRLAQLSTTGRSTLRVDETGSILGSGFDSNFDPDNANSNGMLGVAVNRWVSAIRFVPDPGEWNDFTLARLRIDETRTSPPGPGAPIPEPSSVLLMVVGAGIVATQVRKRS